VASGTGVFFAPCFHRDPSWLMQTE
jgi:hypothetical protein